MSPVKRETTRFTYPRGWFAVVAILIEAATAYLLLAAVLGPDSAVRGIWIAFSTIVMVLAFLFLVPPIFTAHLAGENALRLKMGILLTATVPYASIADVKDTSIPRGGLRVGIGVRYLPVTRMMFVTSSFSDLVVLRFNKSIMLGRFLKRPVEELVLSVSNKPAFVALVKSKAGLGKGA